MNDKDSIKPIAVGILGTILALFVGWAVWNDNRVGFRDAGDIAGLLSAQFSMIATVWIIVTIWMQHLELKLQRQDLKLQREEFHRLAEETGLQAQLMRQQLNISLKEQTASEVKKFIEVEIENFAKIVGSIKSHMYDLASNELGYIINAENSKRFYAHDGLQISTKENDRSIVLKYEDLCGTCSQEYVVEVLREWYLRTAAHNLTDWFKYELQFYIGNMKNDELNLSVTNTDMRLLFNIVSEIS